MPDQPTTTPMPNDANPPSDWENPWGPVNPTPNDYEQLRAHLTREAEMMTLEARDELTDQLTQMLAAIVEADQDYPARYLLVLTAVPLALCLGYPVGIRIDPDASQWPVIYIELPTGQVSWHMPQHESEWDGHTTEEKHARIAAFIERSAT